MHKLKTAEIQTDTTIRLRFEGGAWASMTFQYFKENDWWNVTINSDWGNWSYGWGRQGTGADIFEFMHDGCGRDYFVSKFVGSEPEIFNPEKSAKLARRDIRQELKYWDDRERFQYLINFTKELESEEDARYFVDSLYGEEMMHEVLGDEYRCYWNYVVYERHPRTKYFFDKIFPKFFKHIKKIHRENVKNGKSNSRNGQRTSA